MELRTDVPLTRNIRFGPLRAGEVGKVEREEWGKEEEEEDQHPYYVVVETGENKGKKWWYSTRELSFLEEKEEK